MLISLFIWILFGVWIIVCNHRVTEIIKSTIEGLNFWLSVLYVIIMIITAPVWAIAGIIIGIVKTFKTFKH